MIAVIADDFTGAAEIGGVGLRRGLKVQIETSIQGTENADLLIIATDTRSLPKELARKEIKKITQQLIALNPAYIFKKLDSVLRGNIYDELIAQMEACGKSKALVVAGNPLFKRVIRNGVYSVNKIPLAETSFANDPEFPTRSSKVKEIVGIENENVVSLNVDSTLPEKGIIIGDVQSEVEMEKWVDLIDEQTIAAGGSGFFDILLKKDWPTSRNNAPTSYVLGKKSIFVFGSTFPKNERMMAKFRNEDIPIMNMPVEIYQNKSFDSDLLDQWALEIAEKVKNKNKVVISVSHTHSNEELLSARLRENMGQLLSKVMNLVTIDDLLIEGGATTSMILKYLKIKRLFPFRELDFGVIQMKVDRFSDLCVTTKPGSYPWPDCVVLHENKAAKI